MIAAPIHGRVDRDGRLTEAEPQLLALHLRAGGEPGGPIAVPQIATLARLAQRLGILISRGVVAADGEDDLDLWVRAQPDGGQVRLTIAGWTARPAARPIGSAFERESDFLRAAADWLWEVDESLKLVALSTAAEQAIGGPASRLLGAPLTRLLRLVENEEGDLPLLDALAAQRRFENQPAELRGGSARVMLEGTPLIDGAGRFLGFRGGAAWASPPPAALPAAPIADAFGERLDRALREPLGRIVAQAETIGRQEAGPLRPDYADYAEDIAAAGRHLLGLVDDLVDLQAIERSGFSTLVEPIDLADVARRAAGLLAVRAADAQVRIDRPADDETLPARGEFKRALQILVNLLGNAVRYSPPGGMIWLRGETAEGRAMLTVADQGKGIALEDHDHIFEKFARVDSAEPGGSGLGLYISRRLARAMGGDITVDSALGQGARFTLTLPA